MVYDQKGLCLKMKDNASVRMFVFFIEIFADSKRFLKWKNARYMPKNSQGIK